MMSEADSRLRAAAPELLAELKRITPAVAFGMPESESQREFYAPTRALIARLEGTTS